MNLGDRLQRIPKGVIYLILIACIAIPLINPIGIPIKVSRETQTVYDLVNALEPGSVVVFGFDYTTGSAPEMEPQADALIRHLMQKQVKVVAISFFEQGPMMAEGVFARTGMNQLKYGTDYVNLGYRAGGQAAIAAFGADIHKTFNSDFKGAPIGGLELMKNVKSAKDVDMIITIAPGTPGPEDYVRQIQATYNTPLIAGVPAVAVTQVAPYVQAKQLKGYLAGSPGAAEYEQLLKMPGRASAGMDAQSLAHLLIIGLIVLRNVSLILTKRSKAE